MPSTLLKHSIFHPQVLAASDVSAALQESGVPRAKLEEAVKEVGCGDAFALACEMRVYKF